MYAPYFLFCAMIIRYVFVSNSVSFGADSLLDPFFFLCSHPWHWRCSNGLLSNLSLSLALRVSLLLLSIFFHESILIKALLTFIENDIFNKVPKSNIKEHLAIVTWSATLKMSTDTDFGNFYAAGTPLNFNLYSIFFFCSFYVSSNASFFLNR